jgi:hypothetical protein
MLINHLWLAKTEVLLIGNYEDILAFGFGLSDFKFQAMNPF